MAASSGYRFDPFTLNLDRGCLQEGDQDLDLRPKAFEVLRTLVEHAGKLLSKDDLVRAVWPNVIVNDDALAQCIRDIRKVLRDEGEHFIKTMPRRGYLFVAEVTSLQPADNSVVTAVSAVPTTPVTGIWKRASFAAVIFAVALIAFGAWSVGWFAGQPPVRDTRLTIAVLPFANVGENPGENWLADGIAEDIMTAVSRFRDLTVIARNSSFRYRGEVDARHVGRELSADFLLQGSVRRSGDRLRITAQLVDARTGGSRWTERYDRPFADVFTIQDEVANRVAAQLVGHAREVAVVRLRTRAPGNLEVYELVLRARKAYRTFTREGAIEGRALSERAIAIDPSYAEAWEVLAAVLFQFYIQPYSEHQGTLAMLQEARAVAEQAVLLDPSSSAAHARLGYAFMWLREHEASLQALRKAIELNPNDTVAHSIYGNALSFAGFNRESIEAWERAERLDPFHPAISLALKAKPHIMLREFEPALRLTRSCAERAPRLVACFIYLAVVANELGLEDEARRAARRLLEVYPRFTIERHMQLAPFRSQADAAQFVEYLRRAGLPE